MSFIDRLQRNVNKREEAIEKEKKKLSDLKDKLDSNEIKGGDWFSTTEIEKMLKENPEDFAPGLVTSLQNYI